MTWNKTRGGKTCKYTRAEEKGTLQAEQSSQTCQRVPFSAPGLSVGGQAKQVNSAYQHRFINVFSPLPQMLSSARDRPHVTQEANICSAGWERFAFERSVLWHRHRWKTRPRLPGCAAPPWGQREGKETLYLLRPTERGMCLNPCRGSKVKRVRNILEDSWLLIQAAKCGPFSPLTAKCITFGQSTVWTGYNPLERWGGRWIALF